MRRKLRVRNGNVIRKGRGFSHVRWDGVAMGGIFGFGHDFSSMFEFDENPALLVLKFVEEFVRRSEIVLSFIQTDDNIWNSSRYRRRISWQHASDLLFETDSKKATFRHL